MLHVRHVLQGEGFEVVRKGISFAVEPSLRLTMLHLPEPGHRAGALTKVFTCQLPESPASAGADESPGADDF
jgi:hypothetical protein